MLDEWDASSVAHSLKHATSTTYGRPKQRLSWSFKQMYDLPKLPSSAVSGERRSQVVGSWEILLAAASLCFCSTMRCSSSFCLNSSSLRFLGEANTRLKVDGFCTL